MNLYVCVFAGQKSRLTKEPSEGNEEKKSNLIYVYILDSNHRHHSSLDIYIRLNFSCFGITNTITIDDNILYLLARNNNNNKIDTHTQQRKITMFTCEVLDK